MRQNSIFICYRRTDSGWAGRLEDELKERFADEAVFRDRGIPAGVPWRQHIEGVLDSCTVMLVTIGPSWIAADATGGVARLWQDDDVVRHEIERALLRCDVQVIPILFDGATMPSAAQLPPGIQPLCDLHAHELSDPRWDYDITLLGDRLATFVDESGGVKLGVVADPRRAALAIVGAAAVTGLLAWPVAGSDVWDGPTSAPALSSQWLTDTLERVVLIGGHRAILWAFILGVTLAAAYVALRPSRSGAPAGAVIGLTTGALAGAIGAVAYVLLKEIARIPDDSLLSEPVLNGVGVAVTGALLAPRFALLAGASESSSYRTAGLVGGFVAGLCGGLVTVSGSVSLGWAVQSVLLLGALAALLAAPSFTGGAPEPHSVQG